jgi:hypothetical protein
MKLGLSQTGNKVVLTPEVLINAIFVFVFVFGERDLEVA